jgi:hypothetical protein
VTIGKNQFYGLINIKGEVGRKVSFR